MREIELARSGKFIERHYGGPQDIEWAIDKDLPFPENVLIVQSRPETVWSQREAKPLVEPEKSYFDAIIDTLTSRKLKR